MSTVRVIVLAALLCTSATAAERITFAYFVQWGVYARQYFVKNIDTSGAAARLDVITYAFAKIGEDNKVALADTYADYELFHHGDRSVDGVPDTWDTGALRGNFNQLRKLKQKHPHLRVVVSIGGWTLSDRFSEMASTAEGRRSFADSCIGLFIKGRFAPSLTHPGIFDGIDIDWEYPGRPGATNQHRPEDTRNFTLLLADLRAKLDDQGMIDGRRYSLSVALGASEDKFRTVQLAAIHPHLDWLNLMSYDYHGAWEDRTNFHAALHGREDDPDHTQRLWSDHAVQALLTAGVPSRKINLGVPFYGRGWQGVPAGMNHGLFQRASGGAPGTYGAGIDDFKVLKNLPATFGGHRDPITASYWRYDPTTRVFWTYDDATAITAKRQYVEERDLGGLMIWELSGDDADGTLMKAARPSVINPAAPANDAPTISAIADQATSAGSPLDGILFTIADDHTAASALTIGAWSSNTTLLPSTGIGVNGSGGTRQLRLAPVAGLTGSSTVTVTVSDGILSSSRSFVLRVETAPASPPPPATPSDGSSSGRCGSGSLGLLLGALALCGLMWAWRECG